MRGSEALAARLREEISKRGLRAELREVYCLGRCEHGPNLRIAPGGKNYCAVDEGSIENVLQDLTVLCDDAEDC